MNLQLYDSSMAVKQWQQFLIDKDYLQAKATGMFDEATDKATREFQRVNTLKIDGIVGKKTLGKAKEAGLVITMPKQIEGRKQIMQWIKENLASIINEAKEGSIYTEDWLAGICARETGFLFARLASQGLSFDDIAKRMKGDLSKRSNDTDKVYHGFGFWQIDIDSFPAFVNSGKWQDPLETVRFAIKVLNDKRRFLQQKGWEAKLTADMFERAITAAYNCGEGNVNKALNNNDDIDSHTANADYSKDVFAYRELYRTLV